MPRSARIIPVDGYLHIRCRGNNRQNVFCDEADYRYYRDLLKDLKGENRIAVLHYCLMDNHVHLIAGVREDSTLSRFMKQVNLGYSRRCQERYRFCGHLWQGRYKSCIIGNDTYLLQCGTYIELNPVRAGMVNSPELYGYSSFAYYAEGRQDEIVTENPLFFTLGQDDEKRRQAYRECILDDTIKDRISSERFIGQPEFIKGNEEDFNVRNLKLMRGRPKRIRP